jgi:hypothetical protein
MPPAAWQLDDVSGIDTLLALGLSGLLEIVTNP